MSTAKAMPKGTLLPTLLRTVWARAQLASPVAVGVAVVDRETLPELVMVALAPTSTVEVALL